MNIITVNYSWHGTLEKRQKTTKIILHHIEAITASPADIHNWHVDNGWAGIGYNYYIRKDGNIYTGRPEWAVGAHAEGNNYDSIGIAFEGNFDAERPTPQQITAGIELIRDIRNRYGNIAVLRHKDVNSTKCPGINFDSTRIIEEGLKKVDPDYIAEVSKIIGLSSPDYWKSNKDPYILPLFKKIYDYVKNH